MSTLLSQLFLEDVDDSTLAALLKEWKSQGKFDPFQPFAGAPSFFHAWLNHFQTGLFKEIGPETLKELWSSEVKAFLETKTKGHPSLTERYFDLTTDLHRKSVPASFHWMMENTTPSLLQNVKSSTRFNEGASLWSLLLAMEDEKSLRIWVEKGLPVKPPVYQFKYPFLWETFLKQGGNPNQLNHEDVTEWEYALRRGNEVIREQVKAWATQHQSADLQERDIKEYWKKLGYHSTAAQLKKAMRAHPEWEKLRTEEGFTPFSVAFQRNAVLWIDATTNKKIAALALVRDNKNRNFWFPLLNKGKTLGAASLNWALNTLPMDDASNMGWLNWIRDMNQHEAFPSRSLAKVLLDRTPSEIWLPRSLDDQQALAVYLKQEIWWGSRHGQARIHDFLSECFGRFESTHSDLERVFALSSLICHLHQDKAWDIILENRGSIDIQPTGKYGESNLECIEHYLKRTYPQQWEQSQVNQSAQRLDDALPDIEHAKPSIRL